MKAIITIFTIGALTLLAPAFAQAPATSPLLGRWAVDVSRLPIPPAARPKSVTFTFSDAGGGKWMTQVDIVDAGGSKSHATSVADLEGTPAPIKDSMEADTVALKLPAPNVLVMDLVKGSVPASTRVYVVAADGRTLTETASYAAVQGMPMMRTNFLTRIR